MKYRKHFLSCYSHINLIAMPKPTKETLDRLVEEYTVNSPSANKDWVQALLEKQMMAKWLQEMHAAFQEHF